MTKDTPSRATTAPLLRNKEAGAPTHINPINNTAISQVPIDLTRRRGAQESPDIPLPTDLLPLPTKDLFDGISPLDTPSRPQLDGKPPKGRV